MSSPNVPVYKVSQLSQKVLNVNTNYASLESVTQGIYKSKKR